MNKLVQLCLFETFIFSNFLLCLAKKLEKRLENSIVCFNIIITIIFLTVQEIGIDLLEYRKIYSRLNEIPMKEIFKSARFEPLFLYFINISKKLDFSFYTFNFFFSCVGIITVYIFFILKNKDKNKLLFLYLLINVVYFNTNIIRQNLSMIFFIATLKKIEQNKKTLCWIILSIFSHKVGLVSLTVYLFKRISIKNLKKYFFIKSIIILFLGFVLKELTLKLIELYSGNINFLTTLKGYLINFRTDMHFPTIWHEILFNSYIIYPFFINLVSIYSIKNSKISEIYLKCIFFGNYLSLFFIGMNKVEVGVRVASYFFYINFYVISESIHKNNKIKFIIITLSITFYQILVLIHINRYVRIVPNLFGKL